MAVRVRVTLVYPEPDATNLTTPSSADKEGAFNERVAVRIHEGEWGDMSEGNLWVVTWLPPPTFVFSVQNENEKNFTGMTCECNCSLVTTFFHVST